MYDRIHYKKKKKTIFIESIIIYLENTKKSTKALLKLMSEFSEVTGFNASIQKLILIPHTSNELLTMEIQCSKHYRKCTGYIIYSCATRHLQTD